jgi:predicted metallopeptidase
MGTDPLVAKVANLVSAEYARLKNEDRVKRISFSTLLTNTLRSVGVRETQEFKRLRREVGKFFAENRKQRVSTKNYRGMSF